MSSTVIEIPDGEGRETLKEKKKFQDSLLPIIYFYRDRKSKHDTRKLIHSIKVGFALVLVSLLCLLDPLYEEVGDNAMWAIMTVVVIFEFYAGAMLSKGLNRGIGTILGGGLGFLAVAFTQDVGGVGNRIVVGISVFIFGAAATYSRLVPRIKKTYDYGAMIFILTFNLVAVSGLRVEKVMQLARERLSTILMGFAVCIFTSLLVFPVWAGDELHDSLTSKFEDIARSIEGCLEEYFKVVTEEKQSCFSFGPCKSVLHSKSKDELLANFARWEPWHRKFGLSYPWKKYLQIGEVLREMAANVLSFKGYLRSTTKNSSEDPRALIKEPCELVGSSLAWTLRGLGESIEKMRKCQKTALIMPKLKSMRQELSLVISPSTLGELENGDGIEIASFVFSLMEMVDKVEELTKKVEELGDLAGFHVDK